MATIWHGVKGEEIIESMPTGHLCALLKKWRILGWAGMQRRFGNYTEEQLQAIAKTLRLRMRFGIPIFFKYQHILQQLVPLPCHCGRPGTRVVGSETRCNKHIHEIKGHLIKKNKRLDDARAIVNEEEGRVEKLKRSSELHHQNCGRKGIKR